MDVREWPCCCVSRGRKDANLAWVCRGELGWGSQDGCAGIRGSGWRVCC